LSPYLFSRYIRNLVQDVSNSGIGCRIADCAANMFVWSMVKTTTSQNGDRPKRRHRNGDRNGYIQNGDKPKQHLQF